MTNAESGEKMQIVVDSLQNNPDVVVVGGIERNHLKAGRWPIAAGYMSRTLDIYTHPREPIYDADELNSFMFGLVPELKPTMVDPFGNWGAELEMGKLYYDESIGRALLQATVELKNDMSVVRSGELAPGWQAGSSISLKQRTWVRVFPDEGHLIDAAEGTNECSIPSDQLGKSIGGRVVASLLKSPMLNSAIERHQTDSGSPQKLTSREKRMADLLEHLEVRNGPRPYFKEYK